LYSVLQHDSLQLRDHIDVSDSQTDRHLTNWTLSFYGDSQDERLSGGSNNWSLSWTQGRVNFDDAVAQLANAATVKTEGGFSKWMVSLSRSQHLGNGTSLYLAVSGQRASTNLDSSQKMSIGGPYAVRAYESGVVSGDSGQLVTAELRQTLGPFWGGALTGIAFIDSARVTINRNLWSGATGLNNVQLSGAGLGGYWSGPQQWMARAYLAVPMGSSLGLTGHRHSARGWLETRKSF
jgi:hemolysin activation/secretion protein